MLMRRAPVSSSNSSRSSSNKIEKIKNKKNKAMQTTREKISPEKTSMWGRESFVAARRASLTLSPLSLSLSFSRLRLGFRANRRSTVLSRGKELERFLFLVQRQRWRLERRYSRYLFSDSSSSPSSYSSCFVCCLLRWVFCFSECCFLFIFSSQLIALRSMRLVLKGIKAANAQHTHTVGDRRTNGQRDGSDEGKGKWRTGTGNGNKLRC